MLFLMGILIIYMKKGFKTVVKYDNFGHIFIKMRTKRRDVPHGGYKSAALLQRQQVTSGLSHPARLCPVYLDRAQGAAIMISVVMSPGKECQPGS